MANSTVGERQWARNLTRGHGGAVVACKRGVQGVGEWDQEGGWPAQGAAGINSVRHALSGPLSTERSATDRSLAEQRPVPSLAGRASLSAAGIRVLPLAVATWAVLPRHHGFLAHQHTRRRRLCSAACAAASCTSPHCCLAPPYPWLSRQPWTASTSNPNVNLGPAQNWNCWPLV